MRIGRFFLVACLALIATTGYSQIGVNKRGVSANATAEFNVTNKGILLPRVELQGRFSRYPIEGDMHDGLTVVDVEDKNESVLAYWNTTLNKGLGAWERLANFDRLPKTAIIGFELVDKSDRLLIEIEKDGSGYEFFSKEINFKILNDGMIANLAVGPDDHMQEQLLMSSGIYLIEFIAVFKTTKTQQAFSHYNMGYFIDFGEYYDGGPHDYVYRVERATFSPEDEEHTIVFSNVFDMTFDMNGNEVLHRVHFGLGRSSSSNYRGGWVYLMTNKSYLKITKLK